MKPRIRYSDLFGVWTCCIPMVVVRGLFNHDRTAYGAGRTPVEAYESWQKGMKYLKQLDRCVSWNEGEA